MCVVEQVYEDWDSFKLNDRLEVYGILSVSPALSRLNDEKYDTPIQVKYFLFTSCLVLIIGLSAETPSWTRPRAWRRRRSRGSTARRPPWSLASTWSTPDRCLTTTPCCRALACRTPPPVSSTAQPLLVVRFLFNSRLLLSSELDAE